MSTPTESMGFNDRGDGFSDIKPTEQLPEDILPTEETLLWAANKVIEYQEQQIKQQAATIKELQAENERLKKLIEKRVYAELVAAYKKENNL